VLETKKRFSCYWGVAFEKDRTPDGLPSLLPFSAALRWEGCSRTWSVPWSLSTEAQRNWGIWPWPGTSETLSQHKSFLFLSSLTQVFVVVKGSWLRDLKHYNFFLNPSKCSLTVHGSVLLVLAVLGLCSSGLILHWRLHLHSISTPDSSSTAVALVVGIPRHHSSKLRNVSLSLIGDGQS
jgi:hypothetical protein